eukprot:gnl/Ergobibamus_cyprinoides/4256.p2 GENE.gnl/Ergobibamus_cyprinoides/4256~~gnl/Ergobibamus_cyprinoides/4256.p2  ORF type:complete len:311 (+),score=155.37 gnl/Ergobibamus_cyprinoides/4256:68-934(+)
MSAGATLQFSGIPLNLLGDKKKASYIVTGTWSKKAAAEAKKYAEVEIAATIGADGSMPTEFKVSEDSAYVYLCDNETIEGREFKTVPKGLPAGIPVVADMSSNFLCRQINVADYGLIYACAQKNFGPAGMTVVIVRNDLMGHAHPLCPVIMDYAVVAKGKSMYNTPPTYPIYIAGLVFKWMLKQGGLAAIEAANERKAKLLYDMIDSTPFWSTPVADPAYRSSMNVPFTAQGGLQKEFLAFCTERGLVTLKGHRDIPNSFRASIYNSMPYEGVEALVAAMKEFQALQA